MTTTPADLPRASAEDGTEPKISQRLGSESNNRSSCLSTILHTGMLNKVGPRLRNRTNVHGKIGVDMVSYNLRYNLGPTLLTIPVILCNYKGWPIWLRTTFSN